MKRWIIVVTVTEPAPFDIAGKPNFPTPEGLFTQDVDKAAEFHTMGHAVQFADSKMTLGVLEDLLIVERLDFERDLAAVKAAQ